MLFALLSYRAIFFIYMVAAIAPAIFLMRYIYRSDTWEKEPPLLLLSLAGLGALSALVAGGLERIGQGLLSSFLRPGSQGYTVAFAFLVVALVEEGAKFFFLRRRTWNDPNFDYLFDGIVYSAFVSLGFAAWENVQYVMGYGLSVAFPRAVLAIPAHLGFSVFMGWFYGRARALANRGQDQAAKVSQVMGVASAVFLHGVYDACAMVGTGLATLLFILFVAVMYVVVIRMIRRESQGNFRI